MKTSRREFIEYSTKMSAAALLSGVVGTRKALGGSSARGHPNILLLMVDQQRLPPPGYGPGEGAVQGLKEILGFQTLSPDNAYTQFFPAMLRLRQNAVVFRTHYTASAACVPSRACIMTGSYSTGVEQTDGMFKSAEYVPWLDPNGTPTIGDWFRAAGYTTHYFGKWHVSVPQPPHYLKPWGFSDWESSYPEPHGGNADNLGVYRDVGFADNVVEFLSHKATDPAYIPWLAVGSVVNPHDFGMYPWGLPGNTGVVPYQQFPPPPGIPIKGEKSLPDPNGLQVELNPDGFPQYTFALPQTYYNDSLKDKPRCQMDISYKMGLTMGSKMRFNGIDSPYPFQIWGKTYGGDPAAWYLADGQFYMYCTYLADLRLWSMLQALDSNGLTENTIVVFLPDHGEMAGAHGGMIQKWHNAYEEAIRVPMVISSPLVNEDSQQMRVLEQPTSSIDLAPTLLGLAGFDANELRRKMQAARRKPADAFVGADLSAYARGEKKGKIVGPDGKPRTGVFFKSNDTVTELGSKGELQDLYTNFLTEVDNAIADGYPLTPGSVTQPNNVRALCTGDWKIVRYTDPTKAQMDEWELYCLTTDPIEQTNLVDFRTGEVRHDLTVSGYTRKDLISKN